MKKFTLLFVLVLSSMIVMSQNLKPVVEELWNHSSGATDPNTGLPGEVPSWMGNLTERSFAAYDGKVYILSRKNKPHEIVVLDGATGNLEQTIPIDQEVVKGGTFAANCISITESGKIIFCNLATNTQKQHFKVYTAEVNDANEYTFKELISWTSPETDPYRLGGGLTVYGDIDTDGYIMTANAITTAEAALIFKWNIKDGVVTTEPEVIVLSDVFPKPAATKPALLGITPKLYQAGPDNFWADGHSTYPSLYNMEGEIVSSFKGAAQMPIMSGVSGVNYFSFKDKDFLFIPTTNSTKTPKNAFQLFMIPEAGLESADSIAILPEQGLGAAKNGSYANPVASEVMEDHVNLYMMCTLNGIAAYKLTLKDNSSVDLLSKEESEIQMFPNPTSGKVEFNKTLARVSVYSISGQLILEKSNVNRIKIQSPSGNYIVNGVDLKGNSFKKILVVQ